LRCALERTVTYAYYAETPRGDTFPRQLEFVRECGRSARDMGLSRSPTRATSRPICAFGLPEARAALSGSEARSVMP
jgi:hypothetical protein